jgi:hypothetical protein
LTFTLRAVVLLRLGFSWSNHLFRVRRGAAEKFRSAFQQRCAALAAALHRTSLLRPGRSAQAQRSRCRSRPRRTWHLRRHA